MVLAEPGGLPGLARCDCGDGCCTGGAVGWRGNGVIDMLGCCSNLAVALAATAAALGPFCKIKYFCLNCTWNLHSKKYFYILKQTNI